MLSQTEIENLLHSLFKDDFFIDFSLPIRMQIMHNDIYFLNIKTKEKMYSYLSFYNATNFRIGVHYTIMKKLQLENLVMPLEVFEENKHRICEEIKKTKKYNTFFFEARLSSEPSSFNIL